MTDSLNEREITVEDVLSDDFKPNVVKVHEMHTNNNYFSDDVLANDAEARELEETLFAHGRESTSNIQSSQFDNRFFIIDDYGNKVPSKNALTTFNEYGVNEDGQTISQVLEEEQESKDMFDEYAERYIQIQTEMQRLKTEMKALDIEFKDRGIIVSTFKNAIKWFRKYRKQTPEERWGEGVLRQWAAGSKALNNALLKLESEEEITKDVGKDKEARQQTLIDNMKSKYDKRWERDRENNRGFLDNEIERAAVFASYGVNRADDNFVKLEESKKIREARRSAGLEDLAMHSNEIRPANHGQFGEVFDADFHERRKAFEAKQRENGIFGGEKDVEHINIESVPVIFDYLELAKQGRPQVRRSHDYAALEKKARLGIAERKNDDHSKKFAEMTSEELDKFIMISAKAEDFLDNKVICDQVYLSENDPRREDYNTPAMRIARWNYLVNTKKIEGDTIEYDPRLETSQVKQLPQEV